MGLGPVSSVWGCSGNGDGFPCGPLSLGVGERWLLPSLCCRRPGGIWSPWLGAR